ncbi:hypothetical protein [Bifidobacterium aquikefiri]|nr:hypothetical protein [Bifidobacterium aquikefiri]
MSELLGMLAELWFILFGPIVGGMIVERLSHRSERNSRTATTHKNHRN